MNEPSNIDRLRAAATVYEALNEPGVIGHEARHSGVDLYLAREGIDLVMASVAQALSEAPRGLVER